MMETQVQDQVKPQVDQDVVEGIVNDDPKLHESFEVGDVAHQGDVIIVRIAELPKSAVDRKSRQLADGDTQGSRHVMARGEAYDCAPSEVVKAIKEATGKTVGEPYVGVVFVSPKKPTEHDLTHPEHGHQGFPAGAVCAVVHQRVLDQEERETRALD